MLDVMMSDMVPRCEMWSADRKHVRLRSEDAGPYWASLRQPRRSSARRRWVLATSSL